MMRKMVALIVFLFAASNAFATAQFGDRIIYKGETHSIYSNPLEYYFNDQNPRPKKLFRPSCSACWRGYIATWKVEHGYLMLARLIEGTCDSNADEIPLLKLFQGQNGPIKAVWFTGTLRIPMGKRLKYVHMGYRSVYEKDLFLTFDKGKLVKEKLVDNMKKNTSE